MKAPAAMYPFLHRFDPSRYAAAYLRSGVLEDQVQDACVVRLQARWGARVTVIDSGDRRLRGRLVARFGVRGTDLNSVGGSMERGIADLSVTFPGGRAGWIEVKKPAFYRVSKATGRLVIERPAGLPTREQLEFLAAQARCGAIVGVVWSALDLDAVIASAAEAA